MNDQIQAIHHNSQSRPLIPSSEEAGSESGSPHVKGAPDKRAFARNPIVQRGQDPELFWKNKYGASDDETQTEVYARSLYRHEHIAPELILKNLYRVVAGKEGQDALFGVDEMFGNFTARDELEKLSDYYTHSDRWMNRLIQGDSLLAMNSLLEREGMTGQVQCIYIDPPYGIKYGSNWQIKLGNRTVQDGNDDALSGEPEQIKAFRDTWELGIHSYLSYLRDRLLVARELLHDSGSCFVQISDENVHLVRCLMDEVFGSENFCSLITARKTTSEGSTLLGTTCDYLLWYGKDKGRTKFRQIFVSRSDDADSRYDQVLLPNNEIRPATTAEKGGFEQLPIGAKLFRLDNITSSRPAGSGDLREFSWNDRIFSPGKGTFKTTLAGMTRLGEMGRLQATGSGKLSYRRFKDDFGLSSLSNLWADISGAVQSRSDPKVYVVQTSTALIQRCILMTTDPGDLVLDPTCGSGTTAYVAEQWGRRWITMDTSRIALNIAKSRLMTATFPFYTLYDTEDGERAVITGKGKPGQHDALQDRDGSTPLRGHDVRYGFVYKKVPHVTLGSIANNEPAAEETLYDQPLADKQRMRVAGPFTVETLQQYEPISPEELARQREEVEELGNFEDLVFEHLKTAGVKTGDAAEKAVFARIERLSSTALHAEGFYQNCVGEKKAYLHIGPKFGTVSRQAVNDAIKDCRRKGDGDWLLILGFSFESNIQDTTHDMGNFKVSIVRMHDDLMQEGLMKRDKNAASFVTIGEPDIRLNRDGEKATVEIVGLDIYDPIKDEIKSRDVNDIAYWMLDDCYDGSNFIARQVFFCGGDKEEFKDWKKGLSTLAAASAKKYAELTLKIEIDEEAFAAAYGHISHDFKIKPGQKVAVRVVSQFGEETTKILET